MASGAASGEGEASQPTLGIGQAWLRAVKRDALLQFLLGVHAFGVQHEQAVVSLLGHPGQHTPPGQATTESSQAASPVRRGISAFVLRLFSQQEGSKAPYSPTREDVQAVMQFLAANCVGVWRSLRRARSPSLPHHAAAPRAPLQMKPSKLSF